MSNENNLSSAITYGLLKFPKLIEELPSMLSALDAREYINVDLISDIEYRTYLQQLMQILPLRHDEGYGWYKDRSVASVSGSILHKLLDLKSIAQPNSLTISQSTSCRTPPMHLLILLSKFPSLKEEIPGLILSLKDGQEVQLNGIANEDVRTGLIKLLESVGVVKASSSNNNDNNIDSDYVSDDEDNGYAIPSGRVGKSVYDSICDIERIFLFANIFKSNFIEKKQDDKLINKKKSKHKHSKKNKNKEISSPSSSNNESSNNESSNEDDSDRENNKSINYVGPMMPSSEELSIARLAAKKYQLMEEVANESDDDIGPSLPSNIDRNYNIDEDIPLGGKIISVSKKSSSIDDDKIVREEWMMKPGENKTFKGICF
jgi:hypothetical protein